MFFCASLIENMGLDAQHGIVTGIPVGDCGNRDLRVQFDRRLKLSFPVFIAERSGWWWQAGALGACNPWDGPSDLMFFDSS